MEEMGERAHRRQHFCPTRLPPPYDVDCPVHGSLVTALLPPPWRAPPGVRGPAPALVEYVGTL